MHCETTIDGNGDVLHVRAAGDRTVETINDLSREIMQAAAQHGTAKALVDVTELEGHLLTVDAFSIPSSFFRTIQDRSVLRKCAVIDREESRERYEFFENVAVNYGFNIRIFSDADEAMKWLESEGD